MKSLRNTRLPPRQRQIFQLHAYRVLTHPEDAVRALIDPRLVELFRRIMKGGQDCALCRTCLNFDPESLASPGIAGFVHGDLPRGGQDSSPWLPASPARCKEPDRCAACRVSFSGLELMASVCAAF